MLSAKNWKLESLVRLGFGLLLCLGVGLLLATLFSGGPAETAPQLRRVIISAACFHLGAIGLSWRFLREHGHTWQTGFQLTQRPGRALGLGSLLVLGFLPVAMMLQIAARHVLDWLHIKTTTQAALEALRQSDSFGAIFTLAVITIILAPIAEETLFRGILYPFFKDCGWPRFAAVGTSALFAFIHFNAAIFVALFGLALLLVWLHEKTGNLLAPIAAHATFNAVNFLLLFLADSFGASLPDQS